MNNTERLVHIIDDLTGECKIRDYLKNHLGFSTSLIAKVKYDNVLLNGVAVHMRAIVKNNDEITVIFPEEESENINPIDMPLNIIYEDEYLLAINKPKNMPVHPCRGNHLPTLAEGVRAYLGKPFVFRAVNRLDRDTSGIVLIAKSQLAAAKMCVAMQKKHFDKTYIALVVGIPEKERGTINAPIEREAEGNIKRVVTPDGKESITEYQVIGQTEDKNSIVKVKAITGRTHQIRVHFAHIGHPLVNDFLYGERSDEGKTYTLHCTEITFPHPKDNQPITISCELKI